MAQRTKLAVVLNGLVQNVDLTADELVLNEVRLGGLAGTLLTKTILDGLIANSHAPMSDNQNVVAGAGLTGGGSGATVTVDVGAGDGITVNANDVAVNNTVIRTTGANAFAADQSMGGNKLTNVATPTAAGDAANKAYVDSISAGLDPKASVRASTTGALPAVTYNNGASGVGATLTANANGALPAQDGITLLVGDRLLVKNQGAALQNGIYVVTAVGDGSNPFILTRATDQDGSPASEVSGGNFTFVEAGTANEGAGYVVVWDGNVTVGTDPISWTQFSDAGSAVLSVNGQTGVVVLDTDDINEGAVNFYYTEGRFDTSFAGKDTGDLAEGSNLYFTDERAQDAVGTILTDSATIDFTYNDGTPSITADVKANSISETHLTASVAGDGLTGGNGSPLAVGAGDGIDVAANAVSVDVADLAGAGLENDGSNNLRIATSAYDQSTITGGGGSAAAVQRAPLVKKSMVAGESMAANTSFLVRFALDGETAGRVYKADSASATTAGEFWAIGIAHSAAGVTAGQNIDVSLLGTHVLGSSDTPFNAADIGKAVWLTDAGAFSITSPSDSGDASYKIGMVEGTDRVFVDSKQLTGIN